MEKAKRARKAETPKQPSLYLRLRAPYFYPNCGGRRVTGVPTATRCDPIMLGFVPQLSLPGYSVKCLGYDSTAFCCEDYYEVIRVRMNIQEPMKNIM